MNILLNLILSFYPSVLIWSFIPTIWLKKLDSFSSGDLMHFILRLIIFGIIYFISYKVISKFLSSRFSRSGGLSIIIGVICFVLLFLIVFFQILPGSLLYHTPTQVSDYVLKTPYSFFAVLLPLIYLFFD